KPLADGSPDVVVAEGAIHLRGARDASRIAGIVAALQKRPEVGAIFTRPRAGGGAEGSAPGTLSFDVVGWNHARAGELLTSANWTSDANEAGIKGKTTQTGTAGHGTTSPFDIHNTLIAAGPDFRERVTSDVPTSNADIAPTLLRLLGMPVGSRMTGRVIDEALKTGRAPGSIAVTHETLTAKT